jgi:hypothetical protein
MQYRQGDILIKKIDAVPDNCEEIYAIEGESKKGCLVLALGEATGHRHVIKSINALLMKKDNAFFLTILMPVKLTHEEHSAIELPIGNYQVIRQREYSPTQIRWVAD